MNSYREDCNKAKAVKSGQIEIRRPSGKNGKLKLVVVEYRLSPTSALYIAFKRNNEKDWLKWKSYRSVNEATLAMENLIRKHPTLYEYRVVENINTNGVLK